MNGEMRQRLARNGNRLVAVQCLKCGCTTSPWLKQAEIKDVERLPQWDDTISDTYWKSQRLVQEATLREAKSILKAKDELWWADYDAYLKTPRWRSTRTQVLERAQGICEGCREHEATQVHHLSYKNVGREFLWELVAICDSCHDRVHQIAAGLE